jgi:tetratricopeptide (TPR) repeat protein
MLRKKGQEALFFEAKEALFAKFPKELWLYRTSLELLLQKERYLQEKKAKKEIDEDAAKKQSEGLFQEMRALLFRVRRVLPEKQGFAAYYKARVLHAEQRPLDASLAYEDALRYRKSPYYWQAFLELMSLRLASRQESELRVMFLKGRRQTNDPNHLGALFFFYGRMLLQRYAYREALEALEAAVQHNGKADAYWFSLAEVCAHLGSYSRSLGIYRRYVSMPQYAAFAQKQIAWVQKMERASRASRDIASPPSKDSQE